jgi:hypothetical protein
LKSIVYKECEEANESSQAKESKIDCPFAYPCSILPFFLCFEAIKIGNARGLLRHDGRSTLFTRTQSNTHITPFSHTQRERESDMPTMGRPPLRAAWALLLAAVALTAALVSAFSLAGTVSGLGQAAMQGEGRFV